MRLSLTLLYRVVGGVLLLAALLAVGAAAQTGSPPNVIVIVADDLGYGDLGSYGSPDARTSHLDALAAHGLRFTDFYAGGPICTPSRYALLTGLHAFRAGDPALLDALQPRNRTSGIDAGATTVAEALGALGYRTALIGKWHLGHGRMLTGTATNTEFHPLRHGFGAFFGVLGGAIDYNTHWNRLSYLDWWAERTRRPQDSLLYATHVFGDRAVDYIDTRAGAGTSEPPFFLYLPLTSPHFGATAQTGPLRWTQLPLGREREYLSRFDDLYPDDDNIRKRFLAMTAVLDDEVGRIVEALERNGLMGNTVIWFLSDNGADTNYDSGSNGALRGDKGSPYEGGIRVPSFVVWPGHIPPGTTAQLAGNVDVLPTLLAFAGATPPAPVDGLDLSAFLLGGPPVERGIAVPNTVLGDAYRLGRWKYVRRYGADGVPRTPELYDLAADLGETTDLAGVYPDTLALLESLLPYGTLPGTQQRTQADARAGTGPPLTGVSVSPNPFSERVAISFSVAEAADARLSVHDVLGREVAVVVGGHVEAGVHEVVFDGGGLAPGTYLYRLVVGETVRTGRMTLAR